MSSSLVRGATLGVELLLGSTAVASVIRNKLLFNSHQLINRADSIGAISSGTNIFLSKLMHVDEKPKIVQVAFPFFSGLISTSLMAALGVIPAAALMDTYMVCSTALAGVALIKMIVKRIFAQQGEAIEESKASRTFNYVVVGATTFIPSVVIGVLVSNENLGLIGVFFGLAQVCVTTFLGASQESLTLRSCLPFVTSVLPFAILKGMGLMNTPQAPFAFVVITASAALTALVETFVMSYFTTQSPAEPVVVKAEEKQSADSRSVYRRPGFSTALPHHSRTDK